MMLRHGNSSWPQPDPAEMLEPQSAAGSPFKSSVTGAGEEILSPHWLMPHESLSNHWPMGSRIGLVEEMLRAGTGVNAAPCVQALLAAYDQTQNGPRCT